jgi:antitoxin VapB
MATTDKAKVFMSGRSQAVRIPLAFRFDVDEVEIRRDPITRDIILSQPDKKKRKNWAEIFAAFDAAGVPDDFLRDREQGTSQERETF